MFVPYLKERDQMGKLITDRNSGTTKKDVQNIKIVPKLGRVESSAQIIEFLDRTTEPTQAESSAREMINSNKYVVIDNTSFSSLSNGPFTENRSSQATLKPLGLNIEKEISKPGQINNNIDDSKGDNKHDLSFGPK